MEARYTTIATSARFNYKSTTVWRRKVIDRPVVGKRSGRTSAEINPRCRIWRKRCVGWLIEFTWYKWYKCMRNHWLTDTALSLLRSLAHSNCINFNQAAFLSAVKTGKHIIKHTSKTNIRTLRLCARFKYTSFSRRFHRFSRYLDHCFRSLFQSVSIDYKILQHWSEIIVYLKLFCSLFGHPWVVLKGPLIIHEFCVLWNKRAMYEHRQPR